VRVGRSSFSRGRRIKGRGRVDAMACGTGLRWCGRNELRTRHFNMMPKYANTRQECHVEGPTVEELESATSKYRNRNETKGIPKPLLHHAPVAQPNPEEREAKESQALMDSSRSLECGTV